MSSQIKIDRVFLVTGQEAQGSPVTEANDELISMKDLCQIAADEIGQKNPIHIATVRGWIKKGKYGVVLNSFLRLGIRVTTRADWEKFKEEVAKAVNARGDVLREYLAKARGMKATSKRGQEDSALAS